jgi:hypothetical protein
MTTARFLRGSTVSFLVAVLIGTAGLVACGDGQQAKTAKVARGPMPEGESWAGVYFHPLYGYLHLAEEGTNVIGRWKRADGSRWGELSGVHNGNVLHYQWKEHTVGMVGASATSRGRGYFVYKMDKEGRPVLDGEFGVKEDEVGADWHNVKQLRMQPDLKSIGGDVENQPGGGF